MACDEAPWENSGRPPVPRIAKPRVSASLNSHKSPRVQLAMTSLLSDCSFSFNLEHSNTELLTGNPLFSLRCLHTQPSSMTSALALIHSQPSQYAVAAVAGRKYLLSPRDLLTVPRLNDVAVGDVLELENIHELGSREYTLRGTPHLSSDVVKITATIVEHTKGQMEFIVKKKRRKGYKKTIQHKQTYTRLRIGPFEFPQQILQQQQS
jgi:large subunit ribosomal protein L21